MLISQALFARTQSCKRVVQYRGASDPPDWSVTMQMSLDTSRAENRNHDHEEAEAVAH